MKDIISNNGIKIRWINTAGFEIIMSDDTHILLDPFLSGTTNGLECYPMSIHNIKGCDYLLLSHIHFDHAADVALIQKKFPNLRLFVGDLSADPLCSWQEIDCSRLYRVRPGEVLQFDNLTIEVFSGRHTESPKGCYRSQNIKSDGSGKDFWFGSLELQNYLLTTCDGIRILVWAGMTSEDQLHRFAGINPNIALMHVSPKQNFDEFAKLVSVINPQYIIPHHYDFTEVLLKAVPQAMNQMSEDNRRMFVTNGTFDWVRYMTVLEHACRKQTPSTTLLAMEHHKWYHFGLCCTKLEP